MVGHRLGSVVLVEGRVDKNFIVCAFMAMGNGCGYFLEKSTGGHSAVDFWPVSVSGSQR